MQEASQAYRQSIEHGIMRNRGYIKVSLGIINQLAQETAVVDPTNLFYFSSGNIFGDDSVTQVYATCEQDFSKVDGTMYFAPDPGSSAYYNQGAVSNDLIGFIRITFGNTTDLDIKGFTIDFGDAYPLRFRIETDAVSKEYVNDGRHFTTEDTFNGTSYIKLTPLQMLNGQNRFRINSFACGIANTFTNEEVINYSSKEYVSPICDSLPSMDMSVTLDNQDQYYNPDNPDSALSYMEIGQYMTVQFGYDVDGEGNIEWLPSQTAHLKTWSATDTDAKFTAVDKFDYLLNGKYVKGKLYANGISLYDLAIEVLTDAGITDSSEYYLDDYLRDLTVNNPMPAVKYSEALQIIANAGRCCLYIDRDDRIHMQSNFMPDATITSLANGEASYSHISNVLKRGDKPGYANASQDYSIVDGSLFFAPTDNDYLETGYISEQVSDGSGHVSIAIRLRILFESETPFYGMQIRFRETAPTSFKVRLYDDEDANIKTIAVNGNTSLQWSTGETAPSVRKIIIEDLEGYPNSRVFIDEITFDNTTDYEIYRDHMITGSPTAIRQNRVQKIAVTTHVYSNSTEAAKSLKSETLIKRSGETLRKIIEIGNPSYGYQIAVKDSQDGSYNISIAESGAYYCLIVFSGAATMVQYEIKGYEYVITDSDVTNTYHASGDIITWSNPLISGTVMAQDVADWLGDYYLGDVIYQIPWRGDPRVDANDLFWLDLKKDNMSLIRAYQNELSFNGAWSGTLQARNYRNTYKPKPVYHEANGVLLTFSDPAITESTSYDYVIVYYQPDSSVTSYKSTVKYGGTFSGTTLFVPSFNVWVYWRSDSSVTKSGWSIVSAVAAYKADGLDDDFPNTVTGFPDITEEIDISGLSTMPSAINYGNNERKMWVWDLTLFEGQKVKG